MPRDRRQIQHPADPHRRPRTTTESQRAGTDAEDTRRLWFGHPGCSRLQMQEKSIRPAQVIDSFRDVQAARADLERLQNEAQDLCQPRHPRCEKAARRRSYRSPRATSSRRLPRPRARRRALPEGLRRIQEGRLTLPGSASIWRRWNAILGGSEKLVYDGSSSRAGPSCHIWPLNELTPRRPAPQATTRPAATAERSKPDEIPGLQVLPRCCCCLCS